MRLGSFTLLGIFLFFTSCCYQIKPPVTVGKLTSFSVIQFQLKATLANPTFPQVLTEKLKNKIVNETTLRWLPQDGDLQFEGEITGYQVSNAAQTGNQQVARNRLTVTVHVKCVNRPDPVQNFDQSFTQFIDFDASKTLNSVENQLNQEVAALLTQDIFNRALSNW